MSKARVLSKREIVLYFCFLYFIFGAAIVAAIEALFFRRFDFAKGGDGLEAALAWSVASFVSYWFAITVHEVGHVIAGHIANFRFQAVFVGGLALTKVRRGFVCSRTGLLPYGGLALMIPEGADNLVPRFSKFILGGPVASCAYFAVTLCVAVVQFGRAERSLIVCTISAAFCATAVVILPGTLSRKVYRGFSSDALLLKQLNAPGPERERVVAFALNRQEMQLGLRARDWNSSYIHSMLQPEDGSPSEVSARYLSYYWLVDQGTFDAAIQELERASAICEQLGTKAGHLAEAVAWERVFATAWWKKDSARALEFAPPNPPKSLLALETFHRAVAAQRILGGSYNEARSEIAESRVHVLKIARLFGVQSTTDLAWLLDMESGIADKEGVATTSP